MARSSKKAKPKARKPRAKRASRRDPELEQMQDAAVDMIEIMSCPVLVAEDQAERAVEAMSDAVLARDLAVFAERLHSDHPVAPLLAELALTLERHAGELASLIDRLIPLTNHELSHDHLELDDDAVRVLLHVMFDDPNEEASAE